MEFGAIKLLSSHRMADAPPSGKRDSGEDEMNSQIEDISVRSLLAQ